MHVVVTIYRPPAFIPPLLSELKSSLKIWRISSNIVNSLSFPNDIHANLVAFHPLVTVIYIDTDQTSHSLLKFGNYVSLIRNSSANSVNQTSDVSRLIS